MSHMLRDTPLTPDEIEALLHAQAAALGLGIAPAHLPGVRRYLALASEMAALVNGLDLGVHDDAAGVFTPVSPE